MASTTIRGTRQGRGKHGNQRGGARPGAGQPSKALRRQGLRLPSALIEAATARALEMSAPGASVSRAEVFRRAVAGELRLVPIGESTETQPETLYLTAAQFRRLQIAATAHHDGNLSAAAVELCSDPDGL